MTTHEPPHIHETAIVEAGAEIGSDTRIWHHAHVRAGARIGSNCTIGKNVYVDITVQIGSRTKVQNNVSIYQGVVIGDEVFIGPHAVFTNDRLPRATNTSWEVVPTTVRRGASIGANATIVCGSDIGEWAMVGAGSVVTKPVRDHQLVMGVPARAAGWVCRCGEVLSRAPDPPSSMECEACAHRRDAR